MEFREHNIKLQNIQQHCRTCLTQLNEQKHQVNYMAASLLRIFRQCTGYKSSQDDIYPTSICEQCYEKLEIIEAFQIMSQESMEFLQDLCKSYKTTTKEQTNTETNANELYEADDSLEYLPEPQILLNEDPLEETTNSDEVIVKDECNESSETYDTSPRVVESEVLDAAETIQNNLKTEHICHICFKTYASSSSLSTHKKTHLAKRPFQCEKCDRGFNKRFRLNDHIEKCHLGSLKTIFCKDKECKSKFFNEEDAEAHYQKKHVPNLPHLDANNDQIGENSSSMEKHSLKKIDTKEMDTKEIKPTNKFFMCTICVKNYSSNTALRIHMITHLEKRPFQCDKCERGFNTNARLKRHIDEIHAEKPLEILCKFNCGKVFQRYSTAQAHYKLKHILPAAGIPPKDYSCICEECGKVCKNKYFLTEHSFQHVAYEDLPYICEPCNRRFRSKKHLKRHLVRHEPVKKFQCPHCTLRLATREELRKHINRHTKEIEYPCPICNKIFTGGENMRRHKRIVHEGVKNYKCRYCDDSFGKAETRKHHEMRHTGERPHKCEHCEKSFIQLVALKAHLKTHNKLPKLNHSKKLEMPDANLALDISAINKLPDFVADSQRLTAILDTGGMNKMPIFSEAQKLNPTINLTESNTLMDVSKNLL